MSLDLLAARDALLQAEELLETVLLRDYPVGSIVRWERNSHIHNGEIRGHGYGQRMKVRNTLTDAEYWIYADDVLRAFVEDQARQPAQPIAAAS
jgi:hypothetical protein